MNANATLWIEALRDGRYRQTNRRLKQTGKRFWRRPAFCAMGVLFDLYLKAHGQKWPVKSSPGPLPEPVLEWAGISRGLECDVIGYNDIGMSFRDIASVVEAHLYRLERDQRWQEAGRIASRWVQRAQHAASPGPNLRKKATRGGNLSPAG
jgi:hypothetical protein